MSARSNPNLKSFICLLYVGFSLVFSHASARTDDSLVGRTGSVAHIRKDSSIITFPKDKSGSYRLLLSKGNLQFAINRNGTYVFAQEKVCIRMFVTAPSWNLVSHEQHYDRTRDCAINRPMKKILLSLEAQFNRRYSLLLGRAR